MEQLHQLLQEVLGAEALISATLSGVRKKRPDGYSKVTIKPVSIRNEMRYQFEFHYERKVTHQNLPPAEAETQILALLRETFKRGQFFTPEADIQVLLNKKGQPTILKRRPTQAAADTRHNQEKDYLLPEGRPVDFLIRLGVMSREGKVIAAKYDKFRQINRFLEMVSDVADHLPAEGPLRIVDFGSGKSYLTFALYHYFVQVKERDVCIVGLDLKRDVVDHCNRIAQDLGYQQLSFEVGAIQTFETWKEADLVVSLHACDTATDDALAKAVEWDAQVILSVPCCQHELFRQIRNDSMKPMLKHGIIKERLSALVTDSLRAQMLEIAGYRVQLLEFIDMEHTPKNLLIRAVKQPFSRDREKRASEYREFKAFWNLNPYIERVFEESGVSIQESEGGGTGLPSVGDVALFPIF